MSINLLGCLLAMGMSADPPLTDARRMAGEWLAIRADATMDRPIARVWLSKFTIEKNRFRLSRLMDLPKDLTGAFELDESGQTKTIDLNLDELDFTPFGFPAKIPKGTLRGIYKWDGERLVFCFPLDLELKRPTEFRGNREYFVLTLGRAAPEYRNSPVEVTVKVEDQKCLPVPNATVFYVMVWDEPLAKALKQEPKWQFSEGFKTGKDGTVKIPYRNIGAEIRAWLPDDKLLGRVPVSPFELQNATTTVRLEPAVMLKGSLVRDELKKAGLQIGWTNTTLYSAGLPLASFTSLDGRFEMPVLPGRCELNVYGEELAGRKFIVDVPGKQHEYVHPPISVPAGTFLLLKGKPAPELENVVAWKGEKLKFADQKGKLVLLFFWESLKDWRGFEMPIMMDLHERFKDQGLQVIGVHHDPFGEVNTVEKLDKETEWFSSKIWKGRLPTFPMALSVGKWAKGEDPPHAGSQYGVVRYPTAILIDRAGRVVDRLSLRNAQAAVQEIEKQLAK